MPDDLLSAASAAHQATRMCLASDQASAAEVAAAALSVAAPTHRAGALNGSVKAPPDVRDTPCAEHLACMRRASCVRRECGPSTVSRHKLDAYERAAARQSGSQPDALQVVFLAAAVLAGLRPEAMAELSTASSLAAACLGAALRGSDPRCVRLCSVAAAAIANKAGALPYLLMTMHGKPFPLHWFVEPSCAQTPIVMWAECAFACLQGGPAGEECISALLSSVKAAVSVEQTARNGLAALGWLTRGLAMRGHARTQECLQKVCVRIWRGWSKQNAAHQLRKDVGNGAVYT